MTTGRGSRPFRIRWLGRVRYRDALALQRRIHANAGSVPDPQDHLLLLEHHAVYTLGVRATLDNLLLPPDEVGADLERADRGGDITFHGPGQLVGYPLLHLPGKRGGGMADTVAYVRSVEDLVIDVCRDLGLADVGRLQPYPGVWVEPDGPRPRKVAAIGVKLTRSRTMHGFALNVDPDLAFFDRMVPCGITGYGVTSLAAEGITTTMRQVVDLVAGRAAERWADGPVERTDVAWVHRTGDLSRFSRGEGAGARPPVGRKPEWMRVALETGPEYLRLKSTMRSRRLTTVCEEAGCPNVFDCWNDGTATFMINGERCTRACGFCMVDTRRPDGLDLDEPRRVAEAVADMGLRHAVVTAVARDDLPDGGASAFVATIAAIRDGWPGRRLVMLFQPHRYSRTQLLAEEFATCFGDCHRLHLVDIDRLTHRAVGQHRPNRAVHRQHRAGRVERVAVVVVAEARRCLGHRGVVRERPLRHHRLHLRRAPGAEPAQEKQAAVDERRQRHPREPRPALVRAFVCEEAEHRELHERDDPE